MIATITLASGEACSLDAADLGVQVGSRTIATAAWFAQRDRSGSVYALTGVYEPRKTTIRMHRVILGVTDPSVQVDHINGDGLDNRRENLRAVTQSTNQRNRHRLKAGASGFLGVRWNRHRGKWHAQIGANGTSYHIGLFTDVIEAARAYDAAALAIDPDWTTNERAGRFEVVR